jgi:hypothetical protein
MNRFNLTEKIAEEFTKTDLKSLPNKNRREAFFSVQTNTGKTHDIYLKTINLIRVRSVKIAHPLSDFI